VLAFVLAVVAVALVPAPTRANEAVRKQEEEKLKDEEDKRPAEPAKDERKPEPAVLGTAKATG
jgi:hypothetical protein